MADEVSVVTPDPEWTCESIVAETNSNFKGTVVLVMFHKGSRRFGMSTGIRPHDNPAQVAEAFATLAESISDYAKENP